MLTTAYLEPSSTVLLLLSLPQYRPLPPRALLNVHHLQVNRRISDSSVLHTTGQRVPRTEALSRSGRLDFEEL